MGLERDNNSINKTSSNNCVKVWRVLLSLVDLVKYRAIFQLDYILSDFYAKKVLNSYD